jgi:hypothetical protein
MLFRSDSLSSCLCLSVSLSLCLSVHLSSLNLIVFLSIYRLVFLLVHSSVRPSYPEQLFEVQQDVCLSVFMSIFMSLRLSVCLYFTYPEQLFEVQQDVVRSRIVPGLQSGTNVEQVLCFATFNLFEGKRELIFFDLKR